MSLNVGGTLGSSGASVLAKSSPQAPLGVSDFTSDVGRKRFGFSYEEIDDATAYYEGQFKLHQRFGEGTLHCPETGAKYVGQFQCDQYHGSGDQVWPDGSYYKGQWRRGQKHGQAEYVSADGLVYTGQWEDGRRHGRGLQTYMNNDRYKGGFYHGQCSGAGTYYFADGSRYEGTWANGRYDGPGMLYGVDGSRERLMYSAGVLMKREVLPVVPPQKGVPVGSKRDLHTRNVVFGQSRMEMHRPTVLNKPQTSKYLIRREAALMDLSAPPLKPKTAPARPYAGTDVRDREPPFPEMPGGAAPPMSAPAALPGMGPL